MALAARVAVDLWCWVTDRNAARLRVRTPTTASGPHSHPLTWSPRSPRGTYPAANADLMGRLAENRLAAEAMRDSGYADEAEHARLCERTGALWREFNGVSDSMTREQTVASVDALFDAIEFLAKDRQHLFPTRGRR